jgi:CubicO group peptidase (beta-lactamase class C family)
MAHEYPRARTSHSLSRFAYKNLKFALLAPLALGAFAFTAVRVPARQQAAAQQEPQPVAATMAPDVAEKLKRVEAQAAAITYSGAKAPITFSLGDLMEDLKVPAMSVAVIQHFQIVATKGYGTLSVDTHTPTTPRALFLAGSISKSVTAAAALAMVEHGQLSLDGNVNDQLKSWKVPDNEFTVKEKVTLRRILSHSAGLTVHGFAGYQVGAPIPTVVQVLDGTPPANSPPVRVEYVPGTKGQYSGGGVTIEQLLMTDVSGKPFPELLHDLVLAPAGMTESSFEQPPPAERAALNAIGTDNDGASVPGGWHIYPEMAAAGLWTTPTDLAKFAIEIANSRNGRSNKVMSQKMATAMVTRYVADSGLGFFMDPNNPGLFLHTGADEGFQAVLMMNYDTGNGVALMTNSNHGIAVGGLVVQSVAREFGWNYKGPNDPLAELFLIDLASGPKAALDHYAEIKQANIPGEPITEPTLNLVGYMLISANRLDDAIAVLARNVAEYPQGFNTYDSLGEAYMRNGQKELAIQNYEKSLKLNPANDNAVAMLKKLRAAP